MRLSTALNKVTIYYLKYNAIYFTSYYVLTYVKSCNNLILRPLYNNRSHHLKYLRARENVRMRVHAPDSGEGQRARSFKQAPC